jgi:hypothetical protein
MRVGAVATDAVAGIILGCLAYLAFTGMWPRLSGAATFVLLMLACLAGVLLRRPHGALRPALDRLLGWTSATPRWSLDRALHADLTSLRVSPLLVKAVIVWTAGGLLLAVLVPELSRRGIGLRPWMVWLLIALALSVVVVSEIRRLRGGRGPTKTPPVP